MPGLWAEGKRRDEQAQGGMGVDVVRLGEPALVHAYRHLRVRTLFRVPGCCRPRARAGGLGLYDRRRLAGRRADGAGAGRDCGCGGTAQAMGACLLGALCRRCGRSLGRGAGARRSDRDPGFSCDRIDRSRVYGGLHQRRVAGAGRQGRDRPHLRVGLGVGLLGRACEPGAGARPDRACAGLGPDRHRP